VKGLVAFARGSLGLQLYPRQAETLDRWEASNKRKALLCWGRRAGKDVTAETVALHNCTVPDFARYLRRGERRHVLVVATTAPQAAEFIRTGRELLAAAPDPDLRALVDEAACTDSEIVFRTGVHLRAVPCSSRSSRGMAASLVILNELGHFITTEDGYQAGRAVYRALTPSVAQFGPLGRILVLSTPLWPSGIFYDLFKAGMDGTDPDLFVSQAATWEVNPVISRESLDGEFLADPVGARVEYGAEFVSGMGAFLDADAVQACVIKDRHLLPPLPDVTYVAAADPAFARGGDQFSFAIGHRVGHGEQAGFVLDRLQAWRGRDAPLNSDLVLDEIATLADAYGIGEVISDQYSVHVLTDALRRRGLTLRPQPLFAELKAEIFSSLKHAINLGRIELLDDRALVSELINLEIRPSPAGKPRIQAARGGKDDLAMSVATVVHRLVRSARDVPAVGPLLIRRRRHSERPPWSGTG
jgi:hypothetical protein